MTKLCKVFMGVIIAVMISSVSFGAVVAVSQGGANSTIMLGLAAAAAGDTVEVQDNGTYIELITFTGVGGVTLKAGVGNTPTIGFTGAAAASQYISIQASANNKIKGFVIQYLSGTVTGSANLIMGNMGNPTTVENCTIIGAGTTAAHRGITNVTTITNCDISKTGNQILYDNGTGTVTGCYVHDALNSTTTSGGYGLDLAGTGSAVVANCTFANQYRNIYPHHTGTAVISNSAALNAGNGRSVKVNQTAGLTLTNCLISGMNGTGNLDLYLDDGASVPKLLNFTYCIFKYPGNGFTVINSSGTAAMTMTIDHCDIMGNPAGHDWTGFNATNTLANIAMTNTIMTNTVKNGFHNAGGGVWTSDYNDIFVAGTPYGGGTAAGVNDIVPGIDPKYVQTSNAADGNSFFHLRNDVNADANIPLRTASSTGGPIGSQGVGVPVELLDFTAE